MLPFCLPLFFFLLPKQSYLPNDANQELAKDVNHLSRKAVLQTHLGCQPGHENEEMLGAGLSPLLSFSPFTHRHTGQGSGGCAPHAPAAGVRRRDRDHSRGAGPAPGWHHCVLSMSTAMSSGHRPAVGSKDCCDPTPATGPEGLL